MMENTDMPAAPGIVRAPHTATYEFPIRLRSGDRVRMVVRDDEYPDYWWCVSMESGAEGWVPQSVLEQSDDENATAIADYTAAELTVQPGDSVIVHAEGGGWLWCENESGDYGWIPAECVEPAPDH